MYKILFLFLTLLTSCAAPPNFDLVKAKSVDDLECPDIHIVHAEKEFKVEQKDSNISVSLQYQLMKQTVSSKMIICR